MVLTCVMPVFTAPVEMLQVNNLQAHLQRLVMAGSVSK